MARYAYNFRDNFATAIIKALGLEGQRVRKIILTMEVHRAVTLEVLGYASLEDDELQKVFTLASWQEEQPSPPSTTDPVV